jgi:putative endonuclease
LFQQKKPSKQLFGQGGEALAAEYLTRKGYRIVTRNFKGGGAEIDIVAAWEDDTIVLVEVKRRASDDFGSPAQAVNRQKQKQIIKAARFFQQQHDLFETFFRFDVIAITGSDTAESAIEHIEGAFLVPQ